jgi:Colicin V production protein
MLTFLTILIMLGLAYVYLVDGLATAFTMFCNVFLAGLIAFNFWEPLADLLEPAFARSFFAGYEDALCLVILFSITLGLLRLATNSLSFAAIYFHPLLQRIGGAFFGLASGYLLSGFLLCVFQTLPWHERFMGFQPEYDPKEPGLRQSLPPDRVWLALMHRAGLGPFARGDNPTFDPEATFELRYARYRRYGDGRGPLPYHGEFDKEVRPFRADTD